MIRKRLYRIERQRIKSKIKREIEELFLNQLLCLQKKRNENTWYDSFINYIPEPKRRSEGCFKDKFISLSKTNKS